MSSVFKWWSALAAMVGGALWAITPLREPLFGGRFPGDPVFRPYNFLIVVIAVLLSVGLLALHARYKGSYGRLGTVGVVVIFVGYALMFLGSIPAVLFSVDGSLVSIGQDLGFLGAVISAVGAILLGSSLLGLREASRLGALLLVIAFPVGFLAIILISAVGFEDIAGLPLTVLYGGAWIVLGHRLWSEGSTSTSKTSRVR